MSTDTTTHPVQIPSKLAEAMRTLDPIRPVSHCGNTFHVPIFDLYATCPTCHEEIKVRAFSAATEIEDLFDIVFEWMAEPSSRAIAEKRLRTIIDDN